MQTPLKETASTAVKYIQIEKKGMELLERQSKGQLSLQDQRVLEKVKSRHVELFSEIIQKSFPVILFLKSLQ